MKCKIKFYFIQGKNNLNNFFYLKYLRYSRCSANTEISDKQKLSVPIQSNDCTVKNFLYRILRRSLNF